MEKVFETVVIAGLLHDIGKALQRGEYGAIKIQGQHPKVSADFVRAQKDFFGKFTRVELLEELVRRHHESNSFPGELLVKNAQPSVRPLAYLVSRADNYSSSERGEHTAREFRSVPLYSVFDRLNLSENKKEKNLQYNIGIPEGEMLFPQEISKLDTKELAEHMKGFGNEINRMASVGTSDFNNALGNLLSILEKYLWCIPSNTQENIPDVSLFDHLKTTAAIAAASYRYHEFHGELSDEAAITNDTTEKFLLVTGDLSGIQSYIFDIANIGVGGTAKRLRARSFYLQALTQAVALKILTLSELPICNQIMASGGRFYLLLPNTDESIKILGEIRSSLDRELMERFGASINLNLAWKAFCGKEFSDFGRLVGHISNALNLAKTRPFESLLKNSDSWQEENFLLDHIGGMGPCGACGKLPAICLEDDIPICWRCSEDSQIARDIVRARYIAYYDSKEGNFQLPLGMSISLDVDKPKARPQLVVKLKGWDFTGLEELPISHGNMVNYIPIVEKDTCHECGACDEQLSPRDILQFKCIAKRARGKDYLGVVKADVDNLGALFSIGISEDGEPAATISRTCTLSRMLDHFFGTWVQSTLETKYRNFYSIYSGGDDLLIVGPWDEVTPFAQELYGEFRRYTGFNRDITLSAGVYPFKPALPIYRVVDEVDKELEIAKEVPAYRRDRGRDQFAMFGFPMGWEDLEEMYKEVWDLTNWVDRGDVGGVFLNRLMTFWDMYLRYRQEGDILGLKYLPFLSYYISRNLKDKEEVRTWAEGLKDIEGKRINYLGFISRYAFMLTRGG